MLSKIHSIQSLWKFIQIVSSNWQLEGSKGHFSTRRGCGSFNNDDNAVEIIHKNGENNDDTAAKNVKNKCENNDSHAAEIFQKY